LGVLVVDFSVIVDVLVGRLEVGLRVVGCFNKMGCEWLDVWKLDVEWLGVWKLDLEWVKLW
jgi:hypothetical protein